MFITTCSLVFVSMKCLGCSPLLVLSLYRFPSCFLSLYCPAGGEEWFGFDRKVESHEFVSSSKGWFSLNSSLIHFENYMEV